MIALPVIPPVATGTCCAVTMGTEVDTLMTAFLFSVVTIERLESTLTLFSVARAFSAARNRSAANVNRFSPGGTIPPRGITLRAGRDGRVPEGDELTSKRPLRRAHSMPSLVSSVSVTSAASTSISTWRGILSSFLTISVQSRGYVVTTTAFVTSSATRRISAWGGTPSMGEEEGNVTSTARFIGGARRRLVCRLTRMR